MKKLFSILIFISLGRSNFAQSHCNFILEGNKRIYYIDIADAEKKILQIYEKRKCQSEPNCTNEYNSVFPYDLLKELVIHDYRTYSYDFTRLLKASLMDDTTIRPLQIIKSDDNKMKLYSWDEHGSTMSNYSGITSFVDGDSILSYATYYDNSISCNVVPTSQIDVASGAYKIDTIVDKKGNVIYLVYNNYSGSNQMKQQTMHAYKIKDYNLHPLSIFAGEKSIIFYYTPYDNYDTDLTYEGQEILVPETRENKLNPYAGDLCTGRNLLYKWNGTNFDFDGITYKRTKKLAPSLRNFQYNIIQKNIGDFCIRIDKMPNNSYRYASWNLSNTLENIPNLVIHGGCENIQIDDDNQYKKHFKYTFQNNDFFYIVSWFSDYGDISQIHLIVKHNDKIIHVENVE